MMQIHNKDGFLSDYGLSCGYVEQSQNADNVQTTLWKEHNIYHVRQHDFREGKRVFWDSYEKLTLARKAYKKATK